MEEGLQHHYTANLHNNSLSKFLCVCFPSSVSATDSLAPGPVSRSHSFFSPKIKMASLSHMGQLEPPAASDHMKCHLRISVSPVTILAKGQLKVRLQLLEQKKKKFPYEQYDNDFFP